MSQFSRLPNGELHLENSSWLVRVSTIKLPIPYDGMNYETCLFTTAGAGVVQAYVGEHEARLGHAEYVAKYGCGSLCGDVTGVSPIIKAARKVFGR